MTTLLLTLTLALQAATGDATAFAAQDARFAAMVAADTAYLEKALDSSLTYNHSTGATQTKTEFIAAIRAGGLKYKSIDVIDRQARRFGSVVVITGTYRLQATNNSETIDSRARFTDVYEVRGKDLVQVAWQNTRLP
jgi:hypothetical protein